MDQKKIISYIGKVTSGTMLSRITGYIRDMLVGWLFGAGMSADAFYAALRIPNLLRRLMGEGSMSSSFIPIFSGCVASGDAEQTKKFFNVLFTFLVVILSGLTFLGIYFAPQLTRVVAYGFIKDPAKMQLTILLTRILFPFLIFICLAAFLLSVLNTLKHFFIPAVAPMFLSFSEIFFILGISPLVAKDKRILGLAAAVVVGGLLQFVVQIPQIKKCGFNFKLNFNFSHPGLKHVFLLMIPAMWGISVDQINAFVDTLCASFLPEGSVTALYYSNRLMQLPLALFGIAVSTVSLPLMSISASGRQKKEINNILSYSLKISSMTLIPAMAGLIAIGTPIIRLLFEHGKFDSGATELTNTALLFYCLGLPAYAYSKILAGGFYSLKKNKIPVYVSTFCMTINITLNIILMEYMGIGGLALATAVSSWINAILLFRLLRQYTGRLGERDLIFFILKITVASSFMAGLCYTLSELFSNIVLSVLIPISFGIFIYYITLRAMKIKEFKTVIDIITGSEDTDAGK